MKYIRGNKCKIISGGYRECNAFIMGPASSKDDYDNLPDDDVEYWCVVSKGGSMKPFQHIYAGKDLQLRKSWLRCLVNYFRGN